MGSKTGITWASSTWNPWQGCRRVSDGCLNCYMHREKQRYGQDPSHIHRSSDATVRSILSPQKFTPGSRVFVCSWSDFFLPEADAWRSEAWAMIGARRDLTFLLLTKRPEAMEDRLPHGWPWRHVWLGVTCEDQARADERIPVLLATPAAARFISCEPLLGPLDFTPPQWRGTIVSRNGWLCNLEWVVAGGETGPNARPICPSWVRGIRDACEHRTDMGRPWQMPFHFKSWGSHGDGRLLDGREHNDMPWEVL